MVYTRVYIGRHTRVVHTRVISPVSLLGVERACFSHITRFTVGLEREPFYIHPFHCWAENESPATFTRFTVGLRMRPSSTRFTVGLGMGGRGVSHHTTQGGREDIQYYSRLLPTVCRGLLPSLTRCSTLDCPLL